MTRDPPYPLKLTILEFLAHISQMLLYTDVLWHISSFWCRFCLTRLKNWKSGRQVKWPNFVYIYPWGSFQAKFMQMKSFECNFVFLHMYLYCKKYLKIGILAIFNNFFSEKKIILKSILEKKGIDWSPIHGD